MPTQILATKLHIPSPRFNIVIRPRLIERLNEGLHRKLTLISAPAGFGKTTLLSAWIAGCQQPVSWLSLDDGDNDPARFWMNIIAALQALSASQKGVSSSRRKKFPAKIGDQLLSALQSPQLPSIESILTSLLNEIFSIPDDFILVLDDYHALDSEHIDEAVSFFIERLPPQMHLVISTRQDPSLPLARLRARDQLTELRAKDLRFTTFEAAEFLTQTMGLRLSPEEISALEIRTEGWIAGLQLAALTMQELEDTSSFIQSFTGSHRFILDYLLEEVLHKQPQNIQTFLLQTSILERMCGPLCDAVLLNSSIIGQETLEHLEHANLFIIPLDNERRWYRYHHLFAELLRNRLALAYPDQYVELHRRASDWYARSSLPNEAVSHALTVQDWSRAAEIIEQFANELVMRGAVNLILGWLETFPTQMLFQRVKLGVIYAWVLNLTNQLERAEQHLDQLTPLAQETPPLLGDIYAIRVLIAAYRSDWTTVIDLSRQALRLLPSEALASRSRVLVCLGVAYDDIGSEIGAAQSAFREAFELGKSSNFPGKAALAPAALTAFAHLPDLEWLQGNLNEASRLFDQVFVLAEQWNGQSSIAACRLHWGRASLLYEWNDLEGAARAAQESIRIGEMLRNGRLLVHSYGLSSMVLLAQGKMDDARAMLRRIEHYARDSFSSPPVQGLLALYQITLWLAQNDFPAIAHWEQAHDSEWRGKIGRVRHDLAVILARVCLSRFYQNQEDSALVQALAIIEPALEHTQANGLMLNGTRLLILQALALYAQGETTLALDVLKRALILAEPENYIRSFLDIGKPVEDLLLSSLENQSLTEPHLRAYVRKLLSHFDGIGLIQPTHPTSEPILDPLSPRELEVLRLIAQGLSNRDISERLFLALSTVKGHTRIIFDKLQVHRRTEAIIRARELGLL